MFSPIHVIDKVRESQTIKETNCIPDGKEPNALIRRVSLVRSNQSFLWRDDNGSILDFLEDQGIFPPSSCRQGTCMSCSTVCYLERFAIRQSRLRSPLRAIS